jgi:hypothetical protein
VAEVLDVVCLVAASVCNSECVDGRVLVSGMRCATRCDAAVDGFKKHSEKRAQRVVYMFSHDLPVPCPHSRLTTSHLPVTSLCIFSTPSVPGRLARGPQDTVQHFGNSQACSPEAAMQVA